MEFPTETIIAGIFLVSTTAVMVRWLKADLKRQEDAFKEFVRANDEFDTIIKNDIAKLYNKTGEIMRRKDVVDVVKSEIIPLHEELVLLTTSIHSMNKSVNDLDKSVAILIDRQNRSDSIN